MRRKPLLLLVLILLIFGGVTTFLVTKLIITERAKSGSLVKSGKVIAKVGEENIYEADLLNELAFHPQGTDPKTKTLLLEKLVLDSVTLQAGKKDKLIDLDFTVYNSPKKDYPKRVQLVQKVKDTLNNESSNIEGKIVSIWFRNDRIGELGLEEGKRIAREKLTDLHTQVVDGTLTIENAGERIRADSSLEQIDTSFYVNAIFSFETQRGDPISLSKEFDEALWKLPAGGVSEIFLINSMDSYTGEVYEALYSFGKVTKRADILDAKNYESWLSEKRAEYEISYY